MVPFRIYLRDFFAHKIFILHNSLASLISLSTFNVLILQPLSNLFDLCFFSVNDPVMTFFELVSDGNFFLKGLDIPWIFQEPLCFSSSVTRTLLNHHLRLFILVSCSRCLYFVDIVGSDVIPMQYKGLGSVLL